MTQTLSDTTFVFDARGVAKRFRHAAIFGALESMNDGEVMRFVNDHDPVPLLNQIAHRYQGQVKANYVERGAEGVVIDFSVHPGQVDETAGGSAGGAAAAGAGSCGGGGGGCGCSH